MNNLQMRLTAHKISVQSTLNLSIEAQEAATLSAIKLLSSDAAANVIYNETCRKYKEGMADDLHKILKDGHNGHEVMVKSIKLVWKTYLIHDKGFSFAMADYAITKALQSYDRFSLASVQREF